MKSYPIKTEKYDLMMQGRERSVCNNKHFDKLFFI